MPNTLRIGLVLYPDCMPAGLLAFGDILHAANRRTGQALFEMQHVGAQRGTVTCAHGLQLAVSQRLDELALDAVLIPGFWAESAQQVEAVLKAESQLLQALARLDRQCSVWSYCTGVSLAAAAGRLAGEDATVTWWLADALLKRFPSTRWQTERHCIFNERNATASGVNGYLPIAQALVERHVNPTAAHDLIRLMVLPRPTPSHDAFQALSLIEQQSELLRQLQIQVQKLPAEHITVQVLADALGVAQRTLARRVLAETGEALAAYARRVKLAQVGERLTFTDAPLKSICDELGFSSESNLRRMFKALTDLTPAEYRQRFARF
ncbi:GlxA family transcriptional regulator [Pseudomonas vanderleydeniana]|uniref:Helix-turn-helix domain-containing protein n=1 Tax=Pseudomonas vanderleydeniana TaxID=2745495 RepID=A0A9E6TUC8_9PSED|nr:helix-turn-helix domain-containing protein [Pseudomonas vanderleydeniana]QXI30719.1 helix-turn-helix domain-containing protein [Pseudomonas vanderleydeniana]